MDKDLNPEENKQDKQFKQEETKEGNRESFTKELADFYEAHNLQLYGMNFPKELVEKLYFKLKYEAFDSGNYFDVLDNQDESMYVCQAKAFMKKNQEVFLVDHIWTFKHRQMNSYFTNYPDLMSRVYKLLKYGYDKKEIKSTSETKDKHTKKVLKDVVDNYKKLTSPTELEYLDYDELEIKNLNDIFISKEHTFCLSIEGNSIVNFADLVEFLKNNLHLKAIWMRTNPFEDSEDNVDYVQILSKEFKNLELINSKLTINSSDWILNYLTKSRTKHSNSGTKFYNKYMSKERFLDLSSRDPLTPHNFELYEKFCGEIEILDITRLADDHEVHSSKFIEFLSKFPKLRKLIVDNDEFKDFSDSQPDELNSPLYELISYLNSIQHINPHLEFINEFPISKLTQINSKTEFKKLCEEYFIRDNIWKISNTYRLMTSEKYDEDSIWYIMDEIGTYINHSDTPNVECFPFIFSKSNTFKDDAITYSILWNTKDLVKHETLFRDYLKNIDETKQRSSRLTVWFNTPESYFTNKFEQKLRFLAEKSELAEKMIADYHSNINEISKHLKDEINTKTQKITKETIYKTFNFESLNMFLKNNSSNKDLKKVDLFKVTEDNIVFSILEKDLNNNIDIKNELSKQKKVLVFSDLPYVINNLSLSCLEITKNIDEADILYLNTDYFNLSKHPEIKFKKVHYKNQFPFENIITMKNLMTDLVQNNYGITSFLNLTYNMEQELSEIVGNYIYNKNNYIDNTWILKPINMTRSMDMIVTDNLEEIIRVCETGPKICQSYIHRPLLLNKKKFDLRFIILLKRLVPLELYFYSKMFWIRSANQDFTMDPATFSNYETHFTVMNYDSNVKMQTIYDHQFLEYLKTNNIPWDPIYNKLKEAVKSIFLAAGKDCPQMVDPYARAVYGLDAMIMEDGVPQVLEINFSPDCERACKFWPDFFNDIFSTLYLDKAVNVELV